MDSAEKYQSQLLEQAQAIYQETPLSKATQKAYLETPRHQFVRRYRQWGVKEWNEVNENNLEERINWHSAGCRAVSRLQCSLLWP